ncbi:MAG: hypothetical protein ACTHMM_22655 [Agriterribacter sp.]
MKYTICASAAKVSFHELKDIVCILPVRPLAALNTQPGEPTGFPSARPKGGLMDGDRINYSKTHQDAGISADVDESFLTSFEKVTI